MAPEDFRNGTTGGSEFDVDCGCSEPAPLSRRRFLHWAGRLTLGATAILGGVVRFAPTPAAAASVTCVSPPVYFPDPSKCRTSCLGPCSTTYSCCSTAPGIQNCIRCQVNCTTNRLRIKCVCYLANPYCCAVRC